MPECRSSTDQESCMCRPPTPAELLRSIALARGWVVQGALPDEARAGRLLLSNFCEGVLPHWRLPPGAFLCKQSIFGKLSALSDT